MDKEYLGEHHSLICRLKRVNTKPQIRASLNGYNRLLSRLVMNGLENDKIFKLFYVKFFIYSLIFVLKNMSSVKPKAKDHLSHQM